MAFLSISDSQAVREILIGYYRSPRGDSLSPVGAINAGSNSTWCWRSDNTDAIGDPAAVSDSAATSSGFIVAESP
jgi:hypothetical protein